MKSVRARLNPRDWGIRFGIGILWLLVRLPHHWQMGLGRGLGWLLYHLARERRQITTANIRLCFPELSADEQDARVRAAFASYGMSIFETGTTWLRGVDHLKDRLEIHGLEHVTGALAEGRGVLIIGAHFSAIDIAGALLAHHLEMDVIYRPSRSPAFDNVIQHGRQRYFNAVIPKQDTRQVIRRLKQGNAIWYAADQNYSARHSVFAPFFGIQAATIRGTSRLIKMTGAAAVFGSHFRISGGERYRIDFTPVENFPTESEIEDATRINRLIEDALQADPAQYLWLHRRFKTRPAGEPGFY
ncbi:KDO2-lipid IV(A) lauroyltransferase [Methylohalomonas lacus]|uniref:Lipid A biosynthesis acyltransferase n=1 Tax=Methylohalomonas lacus TaxID=398773 RepID=A0AAE3HLS3_9GAMM|nr:LpxL/LpxP family Kdo(2)-lipid IV(A) lauroyl/palmitoleoyl acyltransferase [Methylohalomonas lacus]MCS3903479.1 KDO2-lipid IV(A) lauroyltransferase [Methylohalomonas lacus]